MSVDAPEAPAKSGQPPHRKRWHYDPTHRPPVVDASSAPGLSAEPQALAQFLSADTLKQLARQSQAGDVRERKLSCVVFFWLTVLAFGPGGIASAAQLCGERDAVGRVQPEQRHAVQGSAQRELS